MATTIRGNRFGTNSAVAPTVVTGPIPPTADPAPLGLAAFASTTLMLSVINANIISRTVEPAVLGMALFFGGAVQVLAGMWEFRRANTFAAVAFSSYGAFWLSFWAFNQYFAASIPAAHVGDAVGLYLLVWGIFTTYMVLASLRVSVAVALVFIALAATYWLLMAANFNGSDTVLKTGGWVGIATAILAFYASFAGVVNGTWRRTLLPVGSLEPPPPRAPDEPMETRPPRVY
ncbi:MAG: acetate uptake transporter [Thermoleophilia bacterium]